MDSLDTFYASINKRHRQNHMNGLHDILHLHVYFSEHAASFLSVLLIPSFVVPT
jgi:hypothetical protein